MKQRILQLMVVIAALLAAPALGYAQQEAVLSGTVTDTTGGVLPGVVVRAVHEASGNTFETVTDAAGGYRLAGSRRHVSHLLRSLPALRAVTRTGLEVLVGQQVVAQRRDAAGDAAGDRHGDGRGSARRRHELPSVREHRSAADAGAAGPGPQLDESDDAGAGQPRECGQRDADHVAGVERRRADEPGRPAGDEHGGARLRPAALQPRRHRRVRVRLEPVRRQPGPLDGRSGQRRHQVRHQHVRRARSPATSGATLQRGRSRSSDGAAVFQPAAQRDVRRPDPARSVPFLRELRVRARAADLHLHDAVSEVQRQPDGRRARSTRGSAGWTISSRRRSAWRCARRRYDNRMPYDPRYTGGSDRTHGVGDRDQPAQRAGAGDVDAGARESGGERDQGRDTACSTGTSIPT